MSDETPYFFIRFRADEFAPYWYLRGTAWTMQFERASHYADKKAADAAMRTAAQYIPAYNARRCRIVQKGGVAP